MFLGEELTQIWESNTEMPIAEKSKLLVKACTDRFGNLNEIGQCNWINNIKRTEMSWQLFAKKHECINLDGLRNIIIEVFGKSIGENDVRLLFGWNK